jgi:hypothetical protein
VHRAYSPSKKQGPPVRQGVVCDGRAEEAGSRPGQQRPLDRHIEEARGRGGAQRRRAECGS